MSTANELQRLSKDKIRGKAMKNLKDTNGKEAQTNVK
jgi:hypothetical protein